MRKRQLIKEAFIASLLVTGIDLILSFFPLKFDFIKPIKQGFGDFDIYDLRYSGTDVITGKKDTNITLLQIADSRSEIAAQIEKVTSLHPKIIGIDAIFDEPKQEKEDSLLMQAVKQSENLVLASRFMSSPDSGQDYIKRSFFFNMIPGLQDGFFNLVEGPEEIKRHFAPFIHVNDSSYPSMTTRMLEQLSPGAYTRLVSRHKKIESINYSGNLNHFNVVSYGQFKDYIRNGHLDDYFRNKIVLIGFFKDRGPDVLEDFHFTPMNNKHGGKSFPDMYGVVIQANILEMLLSEHYINEMPVWLVYMVTFFLLLFINGFYIWTLARYHEHKHFLLFLLQIFLAVLLVYIGLLIFNWFDYKIELMPVILGVVLSLEVFWLYEMLASRMKKIFRYETFVH